MRQSIMRRGPRVPGSAAVVIERPREPEADRLARITRTIAEETGASCALLLGLIERRAPNTTPSDAAEFILRQWRKDGDARARLLDHASKSPAVLAAERELARELQIALRPLAGKAYSVERAREAHRLVVRLLRKKCTVPTDELVAAVKDAIVYREDRIVLTTDGLVRLLAPSPLAS